MNATSTSGPADLRFYDIILASISGGKDSQATLDVIVEAASAAGVLDRVWTVHADMGRAQWKGTTALAAEHARHYGLSDRHRTVRRTGGDLIARILERGMFPGPKFRWCTSDFKRGPINKLETALVTSARASGVSDRPVRVLRVMGHRAQEGTGRSKLAPFVHEASKTCLCGPCRAASAAGTAPSRGASNSRRYVDTWLPIHAWTVEDVWRRIAAADTRVHEAYGLGMSRLSCMFCIFANRRDLETAVRANPDAADELAALETATGHQFRADLSIADFIDQVRARRPRPGPLVNLRSNRSDNQLPRPRTPEIPSQGPRCDEGGKVCK
ncbi:phosphoadenosine phosphosulfate reductase family protein [Nocardia carnea]|uniref:phosphoadenosine phosphosulfate reductase domain-containing protein n=1 Tax=Nocardia carnea TaxID=37328 RepID=UPI0024537FA6|nr:phosphoadenosine phosphosulfate reductase family protein [Nocardia carnea]